MRMERYSIWGGSVYRRGVEIWGFAEVSWGMMDWSEVWVGRRRGRGSWECISLVGSLGEMNVLDQGGFLGVRFMLKPTADVRERIRDHPIRCHLAFGFYDQDHTSIT
jgi:hypothetical protein